MLKKLIRKKTTEVNEVLSLTAKILKLIYIMMIIGIIFITTLVVKEWGILDFLQTILAIASPLFFGFIIAWLFNPLVKILEDKNLSRILATIIIYSLFILIIYLFLKTLLPTIYEQLSEFLTILPQILENLENFLSKVLSQIGDSSFIDIDSIKANILTSVENYGENLLIEIPSIVMNFLTSLASTLGILSLSLIIGFYMLLNFEGLRTKSLKLLPQKYHFEVSVLLLKIGSELRKCVNGTLICAMSVFLSAMIGFLIIGLKAPVLFAFFCGLTDLIPYIGPFIGGAVAVLVGFSTSMSTGFLTLLVVFIIQQLENFFLQPLIMSKSTKLNPIAIIISLLIFGHFFGILGMILATPILSIIKIMIKFIVEKYQVFRYDKEVLVADELKK